MDFTQWIALVAAGTGTPAVVLGFFKWLISFTTGRADARALRLDTEHEVLAKAWQAYRETLEKEVAGLRDLVSKVQDQHEECMSRNHELEKKVAQLQGYMDAQGQLRSEAATMVATERLLG